MRWLILVSTIACNVCANTLLKAAMRHVTDVSPRAPVQLWSNHLLILGVIFSGVTLVLYTLTLAKFELSIAYPVVTSLALVGVFIFSVLLFNEQMYWTKVLGAGMIITGVVLLCSQGGATA